MTELVTIHLGGAGVQCANPLWQLYCSEHAIGLDGSLLSLESPYTQIAFRPVSSSRRVPRVILADLDPQSLDTVRRRQRLFSTESVLSGEEDAASVFARGRHSLSAKNLARQIGERLRLEAESADSLHGFLLHHSLGGGTGSGLTSLILDKLANYFPKKPVLQFAVYPSNKLSSSIVEPYNALLMTSVTKDDNKCCCLVDNEAMSKVLQRYTQLNHLSVLDINWLWSYTAASVTGNMRLGGELNARINDLLTNMVPYPRVRYPVVNYGPVRSKESGLGDYSVGDIVGSCFDPNNQLLCIDVRKGFYTSCCLLFRGSGSPKDINDTIRHLTSIGALPFVPWSPNGLKVSVCTLPPAALSQSPLSRELSTLCTLCSTTAVSQVWEKCQKRFSVLLSKRAFLHWYLQEGMEEEQFYEAQESIKGLIDDYALLAS